MLSKLKFKKRNQFIDSEIVEIDGDIFYVKILTIELFLEKFNEIYETVTEGVTISFFEDKIILVVYVSRNFKLENSQLEKDLKSLNDSEDILDILNINELDDSLSYDYDKYGLCDSYGNSFKTVKIRAFNKKFSFEKFNKIKNDSRFNVVVKLYSYELLDFSETQKQEIIDKYNVSKCAIYITLNQIDTFNDVELFIEELADLGLDVFIMDHAKEKMFYESNIFKKITEAQANLKISESAIKRLIKEI